MPYYKRRTYKKRRYTRKSKDCGSPAELAKTALRGVKYLKTLVNAEKKFHDVATALTISTTASASNLNGIAQGDTQSNRDGISILQNNLQVKGTITKHSSSSSSFVRVVVLRDNQQVGDTNVAWTNIFTGETMDSYLRTTTLGRYQIMMDRVIQLTSDKPSVYIKKYFKLDKHARYNGTAATDIQKNGLYLLLLSDESTNLPTSNLCSRLAYYDN